MSGLTGLALDRSLAHLLEKAEEKHSAWLRLEIVNYKFSVTQEGKSSGSVEGDFGAIGGALPAGPCYFLLKVSSDRWLCLVYLPGGKAAPNPKNRLYAASAPSLQFSVVGEKTKISGEYFFESAAQCKWENYIGSQKSARIITEAEQTRMAVPLNETDPVPVLNLPEAKIDEAVAKAIAGYKAGSIQTVILALDPETLSFVVKHAGAGVLDALGAKHLNKTDPAYVLHKIAEESKTGGAAVTRDVFLHYVPKLASPKLKVAYATYKGVLLHQLLNPELPFIIESWKVKHVTNAAVLEELTSKPKTDAGLPKKPRRRGKGGARMVGRPKFRDDPLRIHTPGNSPAPKPAK